MTPELDRLLTRLRGLLENDWPYVVVELALIWIVVYAAVRFLRGTRGARVVKGVAILIISATLLVQLFGGGDRLERLNFLYSNFLAVVSIMLVIIFQPELRRALVRLGETRFFKANVQRRARLVDEIVAACEFCARRRIGALIAIERRTGLTGVVEAGIPVDAELSRQLLCTIFAPGTALHDRGVVVRGDRIAAAGVQFPLADGESLPPELGSRHRAGVGLSRESDALILIVSEETGKMSVAERGELDRGLEPDALRRRLADGLTLDQFNPEAADPAATESGAAA